MIEYDRWIDTDNGDDENAGDDEDNYNDDDDDDDDDHCHVLLGNKVPEIDRIFPESAQLNERWYLRRYLSLSL